MGPEFESPAGHQKEPSPFGDGSFWLPPQRFEELVATRTSVAAASSMAANLNFALGQNANESPAGHATESGTNRFLFREITGRADQPNFAPGKMQTNLEAGHLYYYV